MSRLRIKFAAITWLSLIAMAASAQAQVPFTSNLATDWLSTFPTTAAMAAATHSTWGNAANVGGTTIWSAGNLSYNWTNVESSTYMGANWEYLPTYYSASTGYATSGATNIATYTYTVPFQAYQFTPGHTNQVAVSPNMTQQVTSKLLTPGGAGVTLPSGWTVTSNPPSPRIPTARSKRSERSRNFNRPRPSKASRPRLIAPQAVLRAVLNRCRPTASRACSYNYGANATSSSLAGLNIPSSAGDPLYSGGTSYSTVTLNPSMGPTYVAWTSPNAGTININLNAWDVGQKSGDGTPAFFVMTSTAGPTAPFVGIQLDPGSGQLLSLYRQHVGDPGDAQRHRLALRLHGCQQRRWFRLRVELAERQYQCDVWRGDLLRRRSGSHLSQWALLQQLPGWPESVGSQRRHCIHPGAFELRADGLGGCRLGPGCLEAAPLGLVFGNSWPHVPSQPMARFGGHRLLFVVNSCTLSAAGRQLPPYLSWNWMSKESQ